VLLLGEEGREVAAVRIASYNVENFFARARALDMDNRSAAKPVLQAFAELNGLLEQDVYSDADKAAILDRLDMLGLKSSDEAPLAVLRQVRGRLVSRGRAGVRVVADGRGDWVGWVELTTEPIDDAAILNTARVIRDVGANVQGVVEAEDRVVLSRFADAELRAGDSPIYQHVMLVDGNDDRGIDVGLLTRDGWPIAGVRPHIDDRDDKGLVFSRDCPEYEVRTPGGHRLVVLMNHLKSKGYGKQSDNDAKRRRQAVRVAEIYRRLRQEGTAYVAVLGDFNDTPGSAPLQPLLGDTDLRDISTHPSFDDGGRPGTFGTCTASNKIDYVLMSPALFAKVRGGGIWRWGAWGGKNGTLWSHYETLTSAAEAGSDHCAIYADVSLS
jgi:endonuclease/exonuclease/phosphatase family metal-dependent hydrolase